MSNATETKLLESVPDGLFIGGEWCPAISGSTLEVHDPATGEVIKTIANAAVEDGAAALDAAVNAAVAWAKTPPRERAEIMFPGLIDPENAEGILNARLAVHRATAE